MTIGRILVLPLLILSALVWFACSEDASAPEEAPKVEVAPTAKLLSLSNDSPHITVIDAETNTIVNTADVTNFTKWTWNDDNNYFDGTSVWLGIKYPESDDAVVIALDVNTLQETARLSVGKEARNIYIGKATKAGILLIGKQASGEVVTIDTKAKTVLETWDTVPVNGGVVCDADVGTGPDGVERFYYPTQTGDTVVSINAETGETLHEVSTPEGSKPLMHTNAPNGDMWVQEVDSHTNSVFDAVSLELIKRFPAAQKPVVATFSPDGKYAYIGHSGDPVVQVVDTSTYQEIKQITVGNTPSKIAVHPDGKRIYAIVSKEASIAVIDTQTWAVTSRIDVVVNPGGLFLWRNN